MKKNHSLSHEIHISNGYKIPNFQMVVKSPFLVVFYHKKPWNPKIPMTYPLVKYHSYWKWPIDSWFTYFLDDDFPLIFRFGGGPVEVHGIQIGPRSPCGHTIRVQPGPILENRGRFQRLTWNPSHEISIRFFSYFFFPRSGFRLTKRFRWNLLRKTSLDTTNKMKPKKLMIEIYVYIYIHNIIYIYICI